MGHFGGCRRLIACFAIHFRLEADEDALPTLTTDGLLMKAVLVKIAFELFELCLEVTSCYVWVDLLDGTSVYEQLIFVKDLG